MKCIVDDSEKKNRLKQSPIGWYGLVNPSSNDFCIRDVGDKENKKIQGKGIDLRKIYVGRRCDNHNKELLDDILINKMKISGVAQTESKKNICKIMRNWFDERNLIEKSFDCGSNEKKRSKFML